MLRYEVIIESFMWSKLNNTYKKIVFYYLIYYE